MTRHDGEVEVRTAAEVERPTQPPVRQLAGQRALLAWEWGRRDGEDEARIAQSGYSEGEQREFLDLVEREYKPDAPIPRVSLTKQPDRAAGLPARLGPTPAAGPYRKVVEDLCLDSRR